ncbi:MAG: D-2-hydroxyacid dehydrogenase [Actinomycetaceae bacterium]|nr:D-2-hydroxyacid dehydrogenase [Actinomycetaceae bacterium]
MTKSLVTVAVLNTLTGQYIDLLRELEPRAHYVFDPELVAPSRFASDYDGDPDFTRNDNRQKRFDDMLMQADVFFGIPDAKPAKLAEAVRASNKLKWVHTIYAGGGAQVRAARLTEDELASVQWTMSAGVHARPLAEWALMGVLAGIKDLPRHLRQQRNHHWQRWTMRTLDSLDAVVIGLGEVGRACADIFRTHAMTVRGVNRSLKDIPGFSRIVTTDKIVEGVSGAHVLVNALPGTPSTKAMISHQVLAALAPGAIVVSIGRGSAIDEGALIAHIRSGHIGFAALDVFEREPLANDSPLWDMDNVLIAPHTACFTKKEPENIVRLFANNLTRFIDGQPLRNPINTVEWY